MSRHGGGRRRRWWRWTACSRAVVAAAGAGLTPWLQDSARPREPYVRENGDGATPSDPRGGTPRPLRASDAGGHGCPPSPEPEPAPRPTRTAVVCDYALTIP
ncbi:hypothetical protein J2Z21_006193 [Streptomyces griseochromogenes]|uniref:Uncharacterized protein n=1 Tax=Streptomyces griseochromogenes TaxID=68214 RepID=A0A1B1AS28_9ACTN|nr:hypothetical protein [Streptomyces griseochromogenes]ANP49373.1 hypothetical protein AVL59_06990 [Streptomyces griseochromogenes]MBP2053202.1 hypothetical protein [Streptomyces griseochromogenes]